MFFSIVIPTYNRASMLVSTLKTVMNQTFSDYEVIVVDDGSTDNTKEVLEQNFPNNIIVYHWQPNSERGAARNKGITIARGQYIIFFDSDDLMSPKYLEILYNKILELGKVNFIAAKHDWLRNGKIEPSTIDHIKEGWHGHTIFLEGNGLGCNFCIKKDNTQLRLFQEDRRLSMMEDWVFLLENMVNDKIYIIDKVGVTLNDHSTRSLTIDTSKTIHKLLFAKDWIIKNIDLTESDIKVLEGNAYLSIAIFNYIGNRTLKSLKYLYNSIKKLGIKRKMIFLFFKNILGVSKIKLILNR